MTTPPPDCDDRPPHRPVILFATLAALMGAGLLGSGVWLWYVCRNW